LRHDLDNPAEVKFEVDLTIIFQFFDAHQKELERDLTWKLTRERVLSKYSDST
jgi:hypothetical protein